MIGKNFQLKSIIIIIHMFRSDWCDWSLIVTTYVIKLFIN